MLVRSAEKGTLYLGMAEADRVLGETLHLIV
jgi:hypothetical protein